MTSASTVIYRSVGSQRMHTWPRWAMWALMSGAKRVPERDIWRGHGHLFENPSKTPLQIAHHYRQLARSWHAAWLKNGRSLVAEANGPGPLSPLFEARS